MPCLLPGNSCPEKELNGFPWVFYFLPFSFSLKSISHVLNKIKNLCNNFHSFSTGVSHLYHWGFFFLYIREELTHFSVM